MSMTANAAKDFGMTTTSTYVPQPGTIPARVVAYLQTLPPGAEVQTGVLVDVLDQPSSAVIPSCHTAISCAWINCAKREGRLHWGLGPAAPRLTLDTRPPFVAPPTLRAERKAAMTPARSPAPTNTPPKDAESAQASVTTNGREGATPNDGPDPQGMDTSPAALQIGTAVTPAPGQREAAPQDMAIPPQPNDPIASGRWHEILARLERARSGFEPTPLRVALWSDGQLELRRGARIVDTLTTDETRALVDYLDRVLMQEGA